jgi:hypothetical protein
MSRIHRILVAGAGAVFVLCGVLAGSASAQNPNQFGCYDSQVRCEATIGTNGTCGYNASWNACTCRTQEGYEQGTYDCQFPWLH